MRLFLLLPFLLICGCHHQQEPAAEPVAPATPKATPIVITHAATPAPATTIRAETSPSPKPIKSQPPIEKPVLYEAPPAPELSPEGLALIVDFEVGGKSQYERWPHPEYSGAGSGVTFGIGYDAHQNRKAIILSDWQRLGESPATRLAATQPYYGASAKEHVREVRDITVPWQPSIDVFVQADVSRTDAECRRAFPGFDGLKIYAQDAIRSLVFNRGASMAGPNRVEMRAIRDLVPSRDYEGMAAQFRKMSRVWIGTEIFDGMKRRRYAEAKLLEKT